MALLAGIALDNTALYFDKVYDYLIPDALLPHIKEGSRVFVPFGKADKKRLGFILSVHEGDGKGKKYIDSVLDDKPYLNDELLKTIVFLKERYFCTYYDALKAVLPRGVGYSSGEVLCANKKLVKKSAVLSADALKIYEYLYGLGSFVSRKKIESDFSLSSSSPVFEELKKGKFVFSDNIAVKNMGNASEKAVEINMTEEEYEKILPTLTKKQASCASLIHEVGTASVKEITYFCSVTKAVIDALEKKGVVKVFDEEIYRNPYKNIVKDDYKDIVLNREQQQAYDGISSTFAKKNDALCALLFGITGSGKTQVYLKLIDETVKNGKDVIIMVPEISLTPQTLSIFHSRYGDKVAVFHSRLSIGQRADEWKRVKDKKVKIVVGTRSAVFAPFENLGLIIIDEEQEHTYKSELTPRYNALEVAKFRAAYNKALLLLSSATPRVESFYAAKKGKYYLATLSQRYGEAELPEVITVDMRGETDDFGRQKVISDRLKRELIINKERSEQSILLLNRRGYNTFASCTSCGAVVTCPNCSISLTYHRANNRLMCHYCGYSAPMSEECPECHQNKVKYSGTGTQKIEEELAASVPGARILRMDTDTTMSKRSHEKILAAFSDGEYDILVGTQMVAKGFDFPNVTLAAVVNADASLYNYDYRSTENTFDLITQVAGRSGRGEKKGRAVIQTVTPENQIISLAAKQDYESFYETEIRFRKLMIYPPYCDLCLAAFISTDEAMSAKAARFFLERLKQLCAGEYSDQKIIVLGPSAAKISKAKNKFRHRIIIKCKNSRRFRTLINKLICETSANKEIKHTTVFADINPVDIM